MLVHCVNSFLVCFLWSFPMLISHLQQALQISPTAAVLGLGRTALVLQEQPLDIGCFPERVMGNKSSAFRTLDSSPSL
jgi:hypothetical protein